MEVKKALTFRASSIGDCLMGKYLLENVHAQFPEARVAIVVSGKAAMMRDLFAAYPWLEVVEANRRSIASLWFLWKNFHGADFVVTQYAGKPGGRFSLWSKLFARLLARQGGLVGFEDASKINRYVFDHCVVGVIGETPALLEGEALKAVGLSVPLAPTLLFNKEDLHQLGLVGAPYAVVHLFAGNKGRGVHPSKKRELLQALVQAFEGVTFVISGGVDDRAEAEEMGRNLPVKIVAGQATLQQMLGLIAGSAGTLSVDTGMAHMSAQLGKPTVVLGTCLGLHWWKPEQYGSSTIEVISNHAAHPGGHIFKDYPNCINDIPTQEVVAAAKRVLQL